MNKTYTRIGTLALALVFVLFGALQAAQPPQQKGALLGRVTDQQGAPLTGVTVYLAATGQGTTTATDGTYTLDKVAHGAQVAFSMIGYTTQSVRYAGTAIDVSLQEESHAMDDVVVVGYGSMRREDLTSSITKVGEREFNSGVVANPINLITGKVPGLVIRNTAGGDPNAAPELQLRGVGSVRAGSTPLIIIDGAYSSLGDLNAINAAEIKSFNVLKDGSSAAIYGTRGSNGVIIVETKRGDAGVQNIEYTSYYYFERPVRQLEVLSAQEYLDVLGRKGLSQVDNDFGFSTSWQDHLLRGNFSYYQGVSFSSGGKNSEVRASVGYRDAESMVINTGNDQLNGRINFRQYFFDRKFTVDGNLSGSILNSQFTDYGAFMQALVYNPTAPVHIRDGRYFEFSGVGPYNPVALLSQVSNRGKTYNYNGSLTATLQLLPSLKWTAMAASNNENYESTKYIDRDSRYSVLTNLEGEATMATHFYNQTTFETYGTYNFERSGHNFTAMLGYSFNREHRVWNEAKNSGFMNDQLGANNIGNGTALEKGFATMGRGEDEARLIAFFGRVSYSYKGKYLFNASLRHEGSTRFGENNKWGWFPAVSAAWRISGEDFISAESALSNLKLRVGYGLTGNQDIPRYTSLSKYNNMGYAYYNGSWQSVYGPTTNPNPNLRWEKSAEYNVGVDVGLWKDRLTLSVDAYYRKTTDLLDWYSAQTPSNIYSTIFTNVGSLSNTGVEMSLGYDILRRKDMNWHIDGAASYNRNKLLSLSNDTYQANHIVYNTLSSPANGQNTYILETGKPIGTYYGFKYAGLTPSGKWIFEDINPDGVYDEKDYTYLGSGLPEWNFSLSSSFNYKNLDFSFQVRGAAGFEVMNTKRIYYENTVSLPFNLLRSAYNTKVNDAATFSDFYLENGNYLKMSNITLGYTFNFKNIKYLKNLRVYMTATNLWTITGYTGVDPEIGSGLTPGFDDAGYFPRSASYIFGLNLKF